MLTQILEFTKAVAVIPLPTLALLVLPPAVTIIIFLLLLVHFPKLGPIIVDIIRTWRAPDTPSKKTTQSRSKRQTKKQK